MVKVMATFILVTLWSAVAFHGNAQSAPSQSLVAGPAPAADCSALIYNMMDCLTFLSNGGKETKPDASCCSGFKSVVEANAECVCYALSSSVSLGLDINITNAETLPSACKVSAPPISACNMGDSPVPSPVGDSPVPSPEIKHMSMSKDGTTEIVFSIIAISVTIALHVFFILPIALKELINTNTEIPPFEGVDIPAYVGMAVVCHNSLSTLYGGVLSFMCELLPFHYNCLTLSNLIALASSYVYTLIFVAFQEKRCVPALWCLPAMVFPAFGFFIACHPRTPGIYELTGVLTIVSGIIMYATPLPLVMKCRKVKTLQYIPLCISIAYFFSGLAWFIVALLASYFDPYLCVTHGVGTILGLLHLGIILNSAWSLEIPRIPEGWRSLIRTRGLCCPTKVYCMEELSKENKTSTELEAKETATCEKEDCFIDVIVHKDDALGKLRESANSRPQNPQ